MCSESAGRVEPDVGGDRPPGRQPLRQPGRRGVEDAPPLEVVEEPREGRRVIRGPARSCVRHTERTRTVHGPARAARSGSIRPHGIVPPAMQTSLARRQRRRRLDDRRRPRGSGAAKYVALAIPLFLFTTIALVGVAGATTRRSPATRTSPRTCPDPKKALEAIEFDQQTAVYDRTGKVAAGPARPTAARS